MGSANTLTFYGNAVLEESIAAQREEIATYIKMNEIMPVVPWRLLNKGVRGWQSEGRGIEQDEILRLWRRGRPGCIKRVLTNARYWHARQGKRGKQGYS